MGRASTAACMPTGFMSGGSCAPIENSPPGIQTMPSGGWEGACEELGTVGRNSPTEAALTEAEGRPLSWCRECCKKPDAVARAATTITVATTHGPGGPDRRG